MDPNTAATVSAIAAVAAAFFAAIVVLPTYWAATTAARSADFDSCLDVIGKLADAERRLFEARGDKDKWEFEFRSMLNLLEGLAQLEKHRRTPKSTREITNEFLVETIAYLESEPSLAPFLQGCITSDKTFSALSAFERKHRPRITGLRDEYTKQKQIISASSP